MLGFQNNVFQNNSFQTLVKNIINFCRNIFGTPNIKPFRTTTVQFIYNNPSVNFGEPKTTKSQFIYNKPFVVFMMNPKTTHVQFRLDTLSYIAKKR